MDVGGGAVHLELFQRPLELPSLSLFPIGSKYVTVHFLHGSLKNWGHAVLLLEELVPSAAFLSRDIGLYVRRQAARLVRSVFTHGTAEIE